MGRSLRVGLVSREYPPETAHGGIGTQTYLKARGLSALGHRVHVLSASTDEGRHDYQAGGVSVTRIPGIYGRLPVYTEPADWVTYSVEVAAAIAELHARAPFDLLDFPEWGAEGFVHLVNQTEWNHIPSVVQIHGPLVMFAHAMGWPDLDSEFYRVGTLLEGTCLRLADALYSSSSCSADWCARHYDLDRQRIPTLHTGVDTARFRPDLRRKAERPTIVFAGRISNDKGIDLLVEAACLLAEEFPGLRLVAFGKGDTRFVSELHALADGAGRPDLLETPGFVALEELPAHLCEAHLFAGPSVHEPGPGLVYLEAMACGLPVVACESAGAVEVVHHEHNGLLVPPKDPDALAAALRRLLADAPYRESMGNRARRYVEETADSRECLRRLEALYLEVASRGEGSA